MGLIVDDLALSHELACVLQDYSAIVVATRTSSLRGLITLKTGLQKSRTPRSLCHDQRTSSLRKSLSSVDYSLILRCIDGMLVLREEIIQLLIIVAEVAVDAA